jgi:type III secretion system YscQ/HrcQ family protein
MTTAATHMDRHRTNPPPAGLPACRGSVAVTAHARFAAQTPAAPVPGDSDTYAIARSLAELDPGCAVDLAPGALSPLRYVLANRFYARAPRTALGSGSRRYTWTWRFDGELRRPRCAVELASAQGTFLLTLAGDCRLQDDWDLDWRPYNGEARLLAWTLYYEPIVVHLSETLGIDLEPTAVLDMLHSGPERTRLDFAIASGEDEPLLRGSLFLPGSAGFASFPDLRGTPLIPPAAADVRVRFVAEIARCSVGHGELAGLSTGDGIVVGSARLIADGASVALAAAGRARVAACLELAGGAVRLIAPAAPRPSDSLIDSRSTDMPDPVAHDPSPPNGPLDLSDVPVTLTFEAGSLELSVADLAHLHAGAVLVLDRRIAESPVTVRANGRVLARGEFVTVNDFLAVRITDTPAHGPQ